MDQNEEILRLIRQRMDIGLERYGHGIRIDDDTRQWGTNQNSWQEMALEELIDGIVYQTAALLRFQKENQLHERSQTLITDFFKAK
uniref:Uncharacterized protein n=1 Tax=viral metagenome TaxID=1070528 RepID=A0A6C0KEI7_9ZZZZ